MRRDRLPNRRRSETLELSHEGHSFAITIGYDDAGQPREVFAGGAKIGTGMAHIIADACVVISLALQHGADASGILKSLGRVPDLDRGGEADRPASVLGEIVEVIAAAGIPPMGGV